jgi:hypothetical protein
LNKRLAAKNLWRKYATEALREASKKYEEEVLKPMKESTDPNVQKRYEEIMRSKQLREARKGHLPLALRPAEAQKMLEDLKGLSDEELLQRYYAGRKIRKKKKKSKLAELAKK